MNNENVVPILNEFYLAKIERKFVSKYMGLENITLSGVRQLSIVFQLCFK